MSPLFPHYTSSICPYNVLPFHFTILSPRGLILCCLSFLTINDSTPLLTQLPFPLTMLHLFILREYFVTSLTILHPLVLILCNLSSLTVLHSASLILCYTFPPSPYSIRSFSFRDTSTHSEIHHPLALAIILCFLSYLTILHSPTLILFYTSLTILHSPAPTLLPILPHHTSSTRQMLLLVPPHITLSSLPHSVLNLFPLHTSSNHSYTTYFIQLPFPHYFPISILHSPSLILCSPHSSYLTHPALYCDTSPLSPDFIELQPHTVLPHHTPPLTQGKVTYPLTTPHLIQTPS